MGFWKWLASSFIRMIKKKDAMVVIMLLSSMTFYLYLIEDILLEILGGITLLIVLILYGTYGYYKEFVVKAG